MKYFKLFSLFIFLFSFTQFVFADCPVNLQCGDRLELSWGYTGEVSDCQVSAPGGTPIAGTCTSGGWTSNGVPVLEGEYKFRARADGNLIQTTCDVRLPVNCGPTGGGTYTISAAPNPVQICSPQTTGKSLISWTAPSGQAVTVRVPSGVFAAGNGNGSQWTTNDGTASTPGWIVPGSNITFTLHDALGALKDSVTVTGTNSGCSTGGTGYCGDSTVQTPNAVGVNEQCDLGSQNGVAGSGCSGACQVVAAVCGNSIREGSEQCDLGSQNGQSGSTCSATCQTVTPPAGTYSLSASEAQICDPATEGTSVIGWVAPEGQTIGITAGSDTPPNYFATGGGSGSQSAPWITFSPIVFKLYRTTNGVLELKDTISVTGTSNGCPAPGTPFANIGFDGAYTKSKTVTLAEGQTSANETVYVTSSDISSGSCNLQKWNSAWQTIGTFNRNVAATQSQSGLTVGTHQYRYVCGGTVSAQATLTVESAPAPTAIDIGWTNTYNPKSKTVTVASGGVTNESLYVTTGGRTGCSLSGYMNSSNQVGVSPVSTTAGFAYSVAAPQRASLYTYTLSCSGVTSVSATLTVNSVAPGTPSVTCAPSPQTIPATFNWVASGFSSDPTCSISGGVSPQPTAGQSSGTFPRFTVGTSVVSCTGGTQTASANCLAQAAPVCGNGIVEPPEECDGGANCSPTTCQTTGCGSGICNASCPQNCNNDNSLCVGGQAFITSPANGRVLINNPFTVAFSFQNVGGTTWTNPTYQVSTTAGTLSNWRTVFGTRALSPTSIAGILGGSQSTNTYTQQFTAPGTAGTYPLAFAVTKNGTAFGDQCLVNGMPQVTVSAPECSDGIDNSDGEDLLVDYPNDPGCSSADDDDETDPAPGATLRISANPQLVRFGGSSEISYEVNNCTIVNKEGDLVPGTWTLLRDGAQIGAGISGTATTGGPQSYPVYDIQNKTTFTLSCGGTTRSATISVIKINEI